MGLTSQAVAPPVAVLHYARKSRRWPCVCSGPRWAAHSHGANTPLPQDLLSEDWEKTGGLVLHLCVSKPFQIGTK